MCSLCTYTHVQVLIELQLNLAYITPSCISIHIAVSACDYYYYYYTVITYSERFLVEDHPSNCIKHTLTVIRNLFTVQELN